MNTKNKVIKTRIFELPNIEICQTTKHETIKTKDCKYHLFKSKVTEERNEQNFNSKLLNNQIRQILKTNKRK